MMHIIGNWESYYKFDEKLQVKKKYFKKGVKYVEVATYKLDKIETDLETKDGELNDMD